MDTTDDLLDRFFAAIEAGDLETVRRLYAPDVEVWHNVTDLAIGRDDSLELLREVSRRVTQLRYEVLERHAWDGGAVQRHVLHGRTSAHDDVAIHICIVFHTADGHITRIREYVDGAAAMSLFAGPDPSKPR